MASAHMSQQPVQTLVFSQEAPQYPALLIGRDGIPHTSQSILAGFFYFTMHLETPCIFATTYLLAVKYLNSVNQKRGHKPWAFTQGVCWKPFVLLHNIGLAVFSLATLTGVYKAISSPSLSQDSTQGLSAIAKSLCRPHGQSLEIFENNAFGRLSTDDLAFWAWIFYLSKFYEVLDTLIILAKGKKSSNLQSYHHAGVIACLWSGIRYMSPPMWIALLFNSFIHTLMYTYFALASIHVNVPGYLKRALTTMQIAQFYLGAILTSLYLFVQYDVPAINLHGMPSLDFEHVDSNFTRWAPVSTIRFKFSSVLTGGASFYDSTSVFNQAGAKVSNSIGSSDYNLPHHIPGSRIRCIDTPGEAVYILAGVAYLIPLIALFTRFFYNAYVKSTARPSHMVKATVTAHTSQPGTDCAGEKAK